ncbi:Sulfite efflux pump SSU1 [Tolypocladium ophioglossoides CBS 100239]|uniref:Sulfite efflux pump SSU1 n=1 Tax=Tolypocladium ophioglossoides (strain CBS 100239) TaxID=1163406 RepID=A0A0L0NG28_TOLOC|nr:Sulfite efflux pump SSU1 [Tolypocladium ophioglossoides CBS 100239]
MMTTTTASEASAAGSSPARSEQQQQQQQAGDDATPCTRQKRKEELGWRRIVRNFTPSWFAVNMGTGIVSVLLHNLPYNAAWLQHVSYFFFAANVGLFATFLALSVLRWAAIINKMIFCCRQWGDWLVYLAWAFWWVDVLLSMATSISMPFIVMHRHKPGLQNTTAALLLPIVPAIVAAATGGIVAEALPDHGHALATLVASYVLWGIGETLAGCVLALYFHRLTVHSLPPREVIVSVFLPVGPLGQGGFAIQQLGKVALKLLPATGMFRAAGLDPARGAEVLYVLGVFLGLIMWGFALLWVSFALISLATTQSFPFNMGWWGFTFPLGVWATCTSMLAVNLDSDFFKVATTAISLSVLLLWVMVAARTLHLVVTGEMFFAPCLKDLREKDQAGSCDKTA